MDFLLTSKETVGNHESSAFEERDRARKKIYVCAHAPSSVHGMGSSLWYAHKATCNVSRHFRLSFPKMCTVSLAN
jgi:hypothetical protein